MPNSPTNLSPSQRLRLTNGARVQYHLAGRLEAGSGVVDTVHPSAVVELC